MLKYIKIIPRFIVGIFGILHEILIDSFLGVNNRFISNYRIDKNSEVLHNEKRTRRNYNSWKRGVIKPFEIKRGLKNYSKWTKNQKNPFFGIVKKDEYYVLFSKDSGLKSFEDLDKNWQQVESAVIDCYMRSEKVDYQRLLMKKINIHKDIENDLKKLDVVFSDKMRLTRKGKFLSEKLWEESVDNLKIDCDQLLKLYSESYLSEGYHDIYCQHEYRCKDGRECADRTCTFDRLCNCMVPENEGIYIKTINGKNIYHFSIIETNVMGEYKIKYMIKYEPLSLDFFNKDCLGMVRNKKESFANEWSINFKNKGIFYGDKSGEDLYVDSFSSALKGARFDDYFYKYMVRHDNVFRELTSSTIDLDFLRENEIKNAPKEFYKMVGVLKKIEKNDQNAVDAVMLFLKSLEDILKENNGTVSVEELEEIYELTKMNCEDVNIYDMKFEKEVQDWLCLTRCLERKGIKILEVM